MIGRLRGKVVHEAGDGTVVLDVNGVGYEVLIPLGSLARAARDEGGSVTVVVHTYVREDTFTLFGFADERERGAFRLLCTVAGVGPRTAVGILGALPPVELGGVVARGELKRLQAVPGIGKKLAERLILELKDKLFAGPGGAVAGAPGAVPAPISLPPSAGLARVVDMLVRLGFKPAEAERAAAELKGRESEPVEELVREALRTLAG